VKLQKVIIRNYCALEDIEINFNELMNLVYGENATGKSSILQLIYIILYTCKNYDRLDINHQFFKKQSVIDINMACEIHMFSDNGKNISVIRSANKTNALFEENKTFSIQEADEENLKLQRIYSLLDTKNTLKDGTVIFGDTDFFYGNKINYVPFNYSSNSPSASFLSAQISSFFQTTLSSKYSLEMQMKLEKGTDYQLPELKKFRNAISIINPDFNSIMVDYKTPNNSIYIIKKGTRLTLEQLSSGECNILLLLGRLCLMATTTNKIEDLIVLIDEIDASLHPDWQAKVIDILKEALPNAQFIITSHSPFIWLGADKEDIIHLVKNENDKTCIAEVDYAEGGNLESIARKYFNLEPYSEDVIKKIEEFDKLLAMKQFDNAREFITQFENDYGADTPTLSNLRTRLRVVER